MKKIVDLIILISVFLLSCGEENTVVPEDDGISWEQISGKLAYARGNTLYVIDGDSSTVKNLGLANLTNLKWNKTLKQITGILTIEDSTYYLEGINLAGNRSILNSAISTEYYDWLPDGRLVTISANGDLLIDGTSLINQTFRPVFGLACSPDGKKIVVSTDNILENYLLEIDINSLDQRIIERNLNLFDPNFLQPVYSLNSDNVFYVTMTTTWSDNNFHTVYHVWSIPHTKLGAGKDPCRSISPQKFLYTKGYNFSERTVGIYSMDIGDGNSVELIKGGHTPIWIY